MLVGASNLYKQVTKRSRASAFAGDCSLADEEGAAVSEEEKPALRFYLIGWGVALIVVGIAGAIHMEQYCSGVVCFLARLPSLGAVALPSAIVLFLILTFHLLTWCYMRHQRTIAKLELLQIPAMLEPASSAAAPETGSVQSGATASQLTVCVLKKQDGYSPLDGASCPSNITNLTTLMTEVSLWLVFGYSWLLLATSSYT